MATRNHNYTIDLDKALTRQNVGLLLATGDSNGDVFNFDLTRSGTAESLSGAVTVAGYFVRNDAATVAMYGSYSGNRVSVALPASCYVEDGYFTLAVRVTANGAKTTIAVIDGYIRLTSTDTLIDPGSVVPSLDDVLNQLAEMEAVTAEAEAAADTANQAAASVEAFKGEIEDDIAALTEEIINNKAILKGNYRCDGQSYPYTITNGILLIDGSEREYSGSGDYGATSMIPVTPGDKIYIRSEMAYGNDQIAMYNANSEWVKSVKSEVGDAATYYDDIFTVPNGVSYIRVASRNCFTVLNVREPIFSLVSGKVEAGSIGYDALDTSISSMLIADKKTEIELTYTTDTAHYINSSGLLVEYTGVPTAVSDAVEVMEGEQLLITAARWLGAQAFAFYSDLGYPISVYPAEVGTSSVDVYNDLLVTVPESATTIRIGYYQPATDTVVPTLHRINSYTVNSCKKWSGKKWTCVGDSLTEVNSRTTMHYHDYIAEETGITVVNMGVSGTGYKRRDDGNKAFYQRVSNVPTDSDVVTIFGSGNDLSVELGTPTDSGTDTLCGCINTTIDNLIAIMPAVSLGIVAPTPWESCPPSITDNRMALYTDALKTICEYRSIPFLDLYHCSNLRPWTTEGRAACYTKDDGNGVHPDETGHKLIAARFKAFLETLIM